MIHLSRDGKDLGQYSLQQVNAMLASGQLRSTDFSWKEGMPNWVPLTQMEGVSAPASPRSAPVATPTASPTAAPRASVTTPVRTNATTQAVYAAPRSAVGTPVQQAGQVPVGTVRALQETRPWVLFLAILGIIGTSFLVLGVLSLLVLGGVAGSKGGAPVEGIAALALVGILFLLLSLLYIYPIIKLMKFCGAIKRLTFSGAAADLDEAMRQQKSFWKFIGILTLISIVINLLMTIYSVVTGVQILNAFFRLFLNGLPTPP